MGHHRFAAFHQVPGSQVWAWHMLQEAIQQGCRLELAPSEPQTQADELRSPANLRSGKLTELWKITIFSQINNQL